MYEVVNFTAFSLYQDELMLSLHSRNFLYSHVLLELRKNTLFSVF